MVILLVLSNHLQLADLRQIKESKPTGRTLVKDGPGWWINFFKDLRDLGNFDDSDPAHVECIRFCFMHIIRKELDQVAELWNQHIISSSKLGTAVVHGVNLTVCSFCLTSTKRKTTNWRLKNSLIMQRCVHLISVRNSKNLLLWLWVNLVCKCQIM